jgi:hypothetical protein
LLALLLVFALLIVFVILIAVSGSR